MKLITAIQTLRRQMDECGAPSPGLVGTALTVGSLGERIGVRAEGFEADAARGMNVTRAAKAARGKKAQAREKRWAGIRKAFQRLCAEQGDLPNKTVYGRVAKASKCSISTVK
jgi:hypothetical protein